ncbi:MAG: ABC transporter ATP-binding protein [Firmicutes bacterium]|nr:ABC transporter ATP-binding protein [Bacillota bacterium]
MTGQPPIIEMCNVTKIFPGVIANDKVNLSVRQGEIHALLGENGAGKSTLMNILYGLYQPDGGEINVRGRQVTINEPRKAIKLGIGMVHQHFMLVEPFTVAENLILGSEPQRFGFTDQGHAEKIVRDLSKQYGLAVDPQAKVRDISVGMQQRVEILKALYRGAEILIMDEPTAVLTPQETTELIQIMEALVREGKTIIFITHKLKEVMAASHRVTVIRRGRTIETLDTTDTNIDQLAKLMVGRDVKLTVDKPPAKPERVILDIRNLHVRDYRNTEVVRGIDMQVRAGEIVGLAGVDGNGQTELVEAITGLRKSQSGSIQLNGSDITNKSPRKVTETGVGHIPEDRHKRGLVLDFDLRENAALQLYYKPPLAKSKILQRQEMDTYARRLIKNFDVRTPGPHVKGDNLSGGNQQKLIIAREVERDPDLLIAAQPTRGLDVGAIEFVHKRLIQQRDQGKAVLLVSLELDEILALADRILVIYEGEIVGELTGAQASEQELGLLMAGAKKQERGEEDGREVS